MNRREMQSVYIKVAAKDILLLLSNLELKTRNVGQCPT